MQERCYEFLKPWAESLPEGVSVAEVGSLDVNGTLRPLFKKQTYTGIDVVSGPNVDVQMPDPFTIPFEDGHFDAIVCFNTLEHCVAPWKLIPEMSRILKVGGQIAIAVPWLMAYHYPPDYFRISPDGMRALVADLPLEIVKCEWAKIYYDYETGTYLQAKKI